VPVTHIAEALHRDACAIDVHVQAAHDFTADHIDAAAGGLHAAGRAAERNRLAGDHTGGGGAHVHRIGIHHPRHDLRVGVHVGRGDVGVRADDEADFAGIAAGDFFEFLARQLGWVNADAAFGAAVRQVDRRVLDRHPRRQCHDFFERDIGVVAHAAFAGAARQAVLDAVTLEMRDAAIVHFDGNIDDQAALGAAQGFGPARQAPEVGDDTVDLRKIGSPGAVGCRGNERQIRHAAFSM
jgi:hypothetical protein